MSNEFIGQLIDQAHAHIIEQNSNDAIQILTSIKLRVHEEGPTNEIKEFHKLVDGEYESGVNNVLASPDDPIRQQINIDDLNLSRAKKYLDFYDRLTKKYDI